MFVDSMWKKGFIHNEVRIAVKYFAITNCQSVKQSFADHVLLAQWKTQDGPQFMAEEAKVYGYPFPYLYDEVGLRQFAAFWSYLEHQLPQLFFSLGGHSFLIQNVFIILEFMQSSIGWVYVMVRCS